MNLHSYAHHICSVWKEFNHFLYYERRGPGTEWARAHIEWLFNQEYTVSIREYEQDD